MGSLTKYYRLYKPNINERNWGEEVNRNWEILDKELFYLEKMIEKLSSMHNRHLRRLRIETEIKVLPVPVKKEISNTLDIEVSYEISS